MIKQFRVSSIEALESRIAPAILGGFVTAGGTLKLSAPGDEGQVQARLTQVDADTFVLTQQDADPATFDGVTHIQAALTDYTDDFVVALKGQSHGSLVINSGDGSDSVEIITNTEAVRIGKVTVNSTGPAFLRVNSDVTIAGPLQATSADGTFGQYGATLTNVVVKGAMYVDLYGITRGNTTITGPADGVSVVQEFDHLNYGNFTVVGGTGGDSISLRGIVDGAVKVSAKDGSNSFEIRSEFRASGNVTYTGGSGNDDVNMSLSVSGEPRILGSVSLALGHGNNAVQISGSGFDPFIFAPSIAGNLKITGGNDSDGVMLETFLRIGGTTQIGLGNGSNAVSLNDVIAFGSFRYTGGNGTDDVQFLGTIGGAATFNLGASLPSESDTNTLSLRGHIAGATLIKGGANNDFVETDLNAAGRLTLNLGEGNNSWIAEQFIFGQGFAYQGGAGADTINLSADGSTARGTASVRAGNGGNVAIIPLLELTAFTYAGGADMDQLGMHGSTPAADIKAVLGGGDDVVLFTTASFISAKLDGGLGADTLLRLPDGQQPHLLAVSFETHQSLV